MLVLFIALGILGGCHDSILAPEIDEEQTFVPDDTGTGGADDGAADDGSNAGGDATGGDDGNAGGGNDDGNTGGDDTGDDGTDGGGDDGSTGGGNTGDDGTDGGGDDGNTGGGNTGDDGTDGGGDDGNTGDDPGTGDAELNAMLNPTDAGGDAEGEARYERRPDRTRFTVEVEDVDRSGTGLVLVTRGADVVLERTIRIQNTQGDLNLDSRNGDAVPSVRAGDTIRVFDAGGHEILNGTF